MKIQKYLWIVCCLVFLLSACIDGHSTGGAILEGSVWVLTDLNGSEPLEGQHPTLEFKAGQISGNTGCNHYGGSYQVEGDSIHFEGIYSTEMACPSPEGIMEQEQVYLDLLRMVNRFELENGELILLVDQGPIMRLSKE